MHALLGLHAAIGIRPLHDDRRVLDARFLGSLRIGVTLAVIGAIVAEWAGGDSGLGVLINLARGSMFDVPLMFATLFTIALMGIALYLIVVAIERRLVRTVS